MRTEKRERIVRTTETTYVLELTQDEVERLWLLAYQNEGGAHHPKDGQGRIINFLDSLDPSIGRSACERFALPYYGPAPL